MTPETEALCKRLEAVESDPIGAGLSNNRYRNPDGPEAAAKLREMKGALERCAECDPESAMFARAALGGSHG